jgi:hypothetical protein
MVDDHRQDIDEFRDEAREHHGAVSDLAARQLPTLREHLRIARSLDRGDGRYDEANDWQNRDRGRDYRDRDDNNRDYGYRR